MQDFVFYSKEFDLIKLAETEKNLGSKEVVLCRNFSEKELTELKLPFSEKGKLPKTNEKKFPVKFFTCHLLVKADSRELNKFKNKTDFIGVLGGTPLLNSFAVSNKKIDFLFKPCLEGRLSFDTGIARTAKQNKTKIIIPFSQFFDSKTSLIRNYAFCLKLMKKFKLNVKVVSFAKTINDLRSVKDLESFKLFLEKKYMRIKE